MNSRTTLNRAATVIEKFLDANHPCDCGPEDYCPGNADEAYALAQEVLEAAAPHMTNFDGAA